MIANWLWRWHWSPERLLYQVIGVDPSTETNRTRTLNPLEESGLVHYEDSSLGRLYMLTTKGKRQVPNPLTMARYPKTVGRHDTLIHDANVQRIVLDRYRQFIYIPARLWPTWQRQEIALQKAELPAVTEQAQGDDERQTALELLTSEETVYGQANVEIMRRWQPLLTDDDLASYRQDKREAEQRARERDRLSRAERISVGKDAIPDVVVYTDDAIVAVEYERSNQGRRARVSKVHKHLHCLECDVYTRVRYLCAEPGIARSVSEAIASAGRLPDRFSVECVAR